MTARIIKKDSPDSEAITADAIKSAGVVIIPTDTVYGFSAAAPVSNKDDAESEAVKKIAAIKGRDDSKQMIRLIARPEDIFLYAASDALQCSVLEPLLRFWPGALTIIVRLKDALPAQQRDSRRDQPRAFRCPGDAWLRKVVDMTGYPIFSTSANKTGSPPLWDIADIIAQFSRRVPLIVDAGNTSSERAVPSTIVDATGDAAKITRQGAVSFGLHEAL